MSNCPATYEDFKHATTRILASVAPDPQFRTAAVPLGRRLIDRRRLDIQSELDCPFRDPLRSTQPCEFQFVAPELMAEASLLLMQALDAVGGLGRIGPKQNRGDADNGQHSQDQHWPAELSWCGRCRASCSTCRGKLAWSRLQRDRLLSALTRRCFNFSADRCRGGAAAGSFSFMPGRMRL